MKYRSLGKGGVEVSCLAVGGNIFGCFCDREETARIIQEAQAHGINFIDTADVYSDGKSEEWIGAAIQGRREQWVIATKVGLRSHEIPGGIGRKKTILNRVETSLKRLKTDYIDLYQMHHFDLATPLEETLTALHQLVQQGKVRYIGASNHSGKQLAQSLQISRGHNLVSYVTTQNHYNLLKRDVEADVLPICRAQGVGAIVYGALARGVLSGKYQFSREPPSGSRASVSASVRSDLQEPVFSVVERLTRFAQKRRRPVTHLALAWVLRRPEVLSILVGARNVAQLKSNVDAVGWPLTEAELAEVDRLIGNLDPFQSLSLGNPLVEKVNG